MATSLAIITLFGLLSNWLFGKLKLPGLLGILGFIIAAVSPAVIVPSMLDFIEKGIGKEKNIPTLILAGASIDDVLAITIFSAFLGMYGGLQVKILAKMFTIPLSIILGIITAPLGAIAIKASGHRLMES